MPFLLQATSYSLEVQHRNTVSPSGLMHREWIGVLSSGDCALGGGTKAYHFNSEPVCNNVPHANETALVGHDDLFLLVTRQCRTHLIRVQHTTVNGPARFDVQRASRRPDVPDLALLVVTGCVHPLPVTAESDLVDGGLVCFRVRILRWLTERTNYLRTLSIGVHLVYFE